MKNLRKVLIPLIILAILSGIIAATAIISSGVSGVTVKAANDFNSLEATFGGTASDGNNPNAKPYVFQQGYRTGKVSVGSSSPVESNQYVTILQQDYWTATESQKNNGVPYIYATVGARPSVSNNTLNMGADDLSKYSYYSFDVDLMAPTGEYLSGSVSASARYANTAGTVTFWNNTAFDPAYYGSDAGGSYIKMKDDSAKVYVDPYKFTHVTVIFENVSTDTSYSVDSYVYVNGAYLGKIVGNTSTTAYYNSQLHASIIEVRMSYPNSVNEAKSLSVDNMSFRTFSTAYDGNLATVLAAANTIDSWESALRKSTDSNPFGILGATNTTQNTYYERLADAVVAANDGDAITVNRDEAETVGVGKLVTIDSNGNSISLEATGSTEFSEENGVYTFVEKTEIYEYVKNGETVIGSSSMTLADVFNAADAGSTVKLLADVSISSTVTVKKSLTFDLNGHSFDYSTTGTKFDALKLSAGITFNIKSSASGGKVFGSAPANGAPLFRDGGQNFTVNIYGDDAEGNTTLSMYVATIVQSWSQACTVNIVGGEYYRTRTDNMGFIQLQGDFDLTVKDALIYDFGTCAFFFNGRYATADVKSNATIDNCVIIASANVATHSFEAADVTFTDCYISGNIKPTSVWAGNASQPVQTSGTVTLGEGCYVNGTLADNVVIAEGLEKLSYNESLEITAKYNKYSITASAIDSSSYTITDNVKKLTFTSYVGKLSDMAYTYVKGGTTYYTNKDTDWSTVTGYADKDSTITFLADVDYVQGAVATTMGVAKNLTYDLNGHTLRIHQKTSKQNILNLAAAITLTVKNGTLINEYSTLASEVADTYKGKGFAVFGATAAGCKLVLENVDTYVTCLLQNQLASGVATVTVSGGEHHIGSSTDLLGGFVESRGNFSFTADDATFYCNPGILFSSTSYKVTSGEKSSTFTFNNCDILATSSSAKIITNYNDNTKTYFNNCVVVGTIAPAVHSFDSGATASASGTIIMGVGTRVLSASAYPAAVAAVSGAAAIEDGTRVSYTVNVKSGYIFDSGFTTVPTTVEYTLASKYVADVPGQLLSYVSGGSTVFIADGETVDLEAILSAMDDGTVVTFYDDVTANLYKFSVSKNVVFDLNGHTLTLAQSNQNDAVKKEHGAFNVGSSKTFTVKNGTLVAQYGEMYKADGTTVLGGKSYTIFSLASTSVLNLENVNTYSGMIAWNYSGNNPKVNINGGNHYSIYPSTDVGAGFFESRSNITVTANDATFYCSSSGYGLLDSRNYYAPAANRASSFTFNNCKIITDNPSKNLINYMNEYTKVYFNGCEIFGSINPSVYSSDTSNGIGAALPGSVVLGEGTTISSLGTMSDVIGTASGCSLAYNGRISKTLYVRLVSGTVAAGDFAILAESAAKYNYDFTVEAAESYTVTWYKEDGNTVIKTETVIPGATVTPPEYTAQGTIVNGWYKADGYDGWTTTVGGTKVTSFVINADTSFYPAPTGSKTAYLAGARYNLSLVGEIGINLYLPEAPDGIVVTGVTVDGNTVYPTEVSIGGIRHSLYSVGTVKANALSSAKTVIVSFTVEGTALSQTLNLSPATYATSVLNDSDRTTPYYPASAHTLVADMVRYSNNLCKYVAGSETGDAALETLLSSYENLCTPLPESMSSEQNVTDIAAYVKSVAINVTDYQPRYLLTFKTDADYKVVDVSVSMQGYLTDKINGANYGKVTYNATDVTYVSGTQCLESAYIESIPMYNFSNTVTITVLLENGVTKSGTYNLGAYYNAVAASDARLSALVLSLNVLGASSASYKYADVAVSESESAFWNCEHENTESITLIAQDAALPFKALTSYCGTCDSYFIYYKDFGAVGDGVSNGLNSDGTANVSGTNDFAAIREAHTVANILADVFPEKRIVVVGEGIEGNTFYMGYPDDGGARGIEIQTNVDWNGTHFIIDDTTVTNLDSTRTAYHQEIFSVIGDKTIRGTSYTAAIPDGIASGATNIGFAPGRPVMLQISLKSVKHYIRQGANANSGQNQTEIIIVDANGNVDPTTPVQWDYTNVAFCTYGCTPVDSGSDGTCDTCKTSIGKAFTATAYSADDAPIFISGYDKNGNINCTWETITNKNVNVVKTYDAVARNIEISRSNVTIQGINRLFIEDNTNTTPRQAYEGYIETYYAYNTVIKDMSVYQHLGHYMQDESGNNYYYDANGNKVTNSLGSYEYSGSHSVGTSWIRCIQRNFFKDDGTVSYRGMFGTNYMRNSYLEGCILSSFDSHSGAYNVTIENSTFEHVNFVGGGDAIIRNSVLYLEGGQGVCNLRQDYGSMWAGDIKIDGVQLRHASGYSNGTELIRAYYTNHYFGFATELPTRVYVNNLSMMQYTARTTPAYTHTAGIIDDSTLTKSSKSVTIYSGVNSQMTQDIDYSVVSSSNLDPKKCTEAIYITNSDVSFTYPNHWFFENMKIYIDGTEQNWFKVRSGLHTDTGTVNDGKCDTCGHTGLCTNHKTSGSDTETCGTCGATVKKDSSCLVEGTRVLMADGSYRAVELLEIGDEILAYNHVTGMLEVTKVWFNFHSIEDAEDFEVINLKFEDGTVLRIAYVHALFDTELQKYVYLSAENAKEFIGHEFLKTELVDGNTVVSSVELVDVYFTNENVKVFAPFSEQHINVIAEDMLTAVTAMNGLDEVINIFDFDENGVYIAENMKADIEKYGMYTYADFAHLVSEAEFNSSPFAYFKVAVGKGLITFEGLEAMINLLIDGGYLEGPTA